MTKTNVERTLETLVEFADVHRQSLTRLTESIETMNTHLGERIERLGEKIEQGNQRLVDRIDDLAVKIGDQSKSIDRLNQTVDRLTQAIDGHLRVAEAQTANIAELAKLVTIQASTVNKLIDRVAA